MALGARLNQVTAWKVTKNNVTVLSPTTSGCADQRRNASYPPAPCASAQSSFTRYTTNHATKTLLTSRRMKAKYAGRSSHQYVEGRVRCHWGW
jgi:hypothetical protein